MKAVMSIHLEIPLNEIAKNPEISRALNLLIEAVGGKAIPENHCDALPCDAPQQKDTETLEDADAPPQKDTDALEAADSSEEEPTEPVTVEQLREKARTLAKQDGLNLEKIKDILKNRFGVSNISSVDKSRYSECYKALEALQ